MVLQARAKGVPLGVYAAGHPPSTVGVHQRKYSSIYHRTMRDSLFTLTSTSMYTSSTHTTTIITDQYDATNRIRIEDDLPSTYRQYYKTGAVQADVAMSET